MLCNSELQTLTASQNVIETNKTETSTHIEQVQNCEEAVSSNKVSQYSTIQDEEEMLDIPDKYTRLSEFQMYVDYDTQQSMVEDVILACKIIQSGVHNQFGCCIPVRSAWNLTQFEHLLTQAKLDCEVIEWLRYGFPVSWQENTVQLIPATTNHMGAMLFPQCIDAYFEKEIQLGATMGLFTIPPFLNRIGISPLSSHPKRETVQRRIILDLSFPFGNSVNDGIDKDYYCGQKVKLVYPSVDTLAERIVQLKQKHNGTVLLYKRDLSRYFRQVPLCPMDYSLIGMRWRNFLFFDKFMPMGLRSACFVA